MVVGWRRMRNSRRRNSYTRRSSFRRRSSRRKRGRRRSRGKRSSRMSKATGYLVFKIRMIYHHQVGRELGRLPQPQHRNVRREGEF